ncbi:MAG TPA: PIG-L family deacetylase [Methylomirabilota bacterium]
MGRLVVLSPHCDDAVFGCGELLADRPDGVVVTVFAGRPPAGRPLTAWDAAAGFGEGDDVVSARRAEDRRALSVLGARPRWLPFSDAQYGGPLAPAAVTPALAEAVLGCRPAVVAIPLGLFHDDHKTTHAAARRLLGARPGVEWLFYADAIYRRVGGAVDERLAELRAAGLAPRPVAPTARRHPALKRRAVACYRSQLRALASPGRPGWLDALEPEYYWRVTA